MDSRSDAWDSALSHLNDLVDRFAARGVRFISITDESREVVARFLEQRRIAGWVGIDTDRSTFVDYGADALPRTVLVDGSGRKFTLPDITVDGMQRLVQGKLREFGRPGFVGWFLTRGSPRLERWRQPAR